MTTNINFNKIFQNPHTSLQTLTEAPAITNFFNYLYDFVHEIVTGRKYYSELDRMHQELITFVAVAGHEISSNFSVDIDSGIFRIIDEYGNAGAYQMKRRKGFVSVHKLNVHSFDDLKNDTDYSSTIIHSWNFNRIINLTYALRNNVTFFTFIDRFKPQQVIIEEPEITDLSNFLKEKIDQNALKHMRKGAIKNQTQKLYFLTPGKYHVFKFVQSEDSLKVSEIRYDVFKNVPYEVEYGRLRGMTLSSLNDL